MKKQFIILILSICLLLTGYSLAAVGHTAECSISEYSVDCCAKKFNITAKTGYKIVDIIVNGESLGLSSYSSPYTYEFTNTINKAQTLRVVSEPIKYSITYNLDGGTVTGNPTGYTVKTETFTLNNPTKTGYKFMGWTGTGLDSASTNVTITKGSTGNKIYTANWQEDENQSKKIIYKVQYYKGGNYIYSDDVLVEKDVWINSEAEITVMESDINISNSKYQGYRFDHLELNNSIITLPRTVKDGEIIKVYYVKDDSKYLDVNFIASEGGYLTGTTKFTSILTGTAWSDAVTVPTPIANTGYKFNGWDKTFPSTITESITYKAVFVKDESQTKALSYFVEYYKDSSLAEKLTVSKSVWANDTMLSVDPVDTSSNRYAGYKFSDTIPKLIPEKIADGGVIKVYYEKDESKYLDVNFMASEGGYLTGTTKFTNILTGTAWNDAVTVPTPKANTGYKFSSWSSTFPDTITSDLEYTAEFIKDETQTKNVSYKVKYYKDNVWAETKTLSKTVWINDNTFTVDSVDAEENRYMGYKLSSIDPTIPATLTVNEVINVYYVMDPTQTKKLSYTVEYYKDSEKIGIETVEKDVWINATTLPVTEINKSKYEGYAFSYTDPNPCPTTIIGGGVIKAYYIKDDSQYATITFIAGDNGSISGETYYEVLKGTSWDKSGIDVDKISKNPDIGYKFSNWDKSFPKTITESATYTAIFDPLSYDLTVSVSPENAGSVTDGVNTTKTTMTISKEFGSTIILTANESSGYEFEAQWYVEGASYSQTGSNKIEIIMPANDVTVKAVFVTKSFMVSGVINPTGSGIINESGRSYSYGSEVNLTASPQIGYEFSSWSEVSGVLDYKIDGNKITFTMPANDVTVTAKFKKQTFTITSAAGKGGSISPNPSASIEYGNSIEFAITPNTGYKISSMKVDNVEQTITNAAGMTYKFSNVIKNHTISVNFEPIVYTITYGLNDGTVEGTNPTSYTVETDTFTLINPTKTGYTFDGWVIGSSPIQNTVTITKGSTGNRTYTAYWSTNNYIVTGSVEGSGSITSGTGSKAYNSTVTLTAKNSEGYIFDRWEVISENVSLEDRYSEITTFTMPASNVEVKAYFIKTYTITINIVGSGSSAINSSNYATVKVSGAVEKTITASSTSIYVPEGKSISISRTVVSGTGYKEGTQELDGVEMSMYSINQGLQNITSDHTVDLAILRVLTVYYQLNGGTDPDGDTYFTDVHYPTSSNTTFSLINDPTLADVTCGEAKFIEWNTKADGSGIGYDAGASYTDTRYSTNITFYAIWGYDVKYNTMGGSGSFPAQTKLHGKSLTLSSNVPTKSGYTFAGWYVNSSCTGTQYDPGEVYTSDANVVLYAKWISLEVGGFIEYVPTVESYVIPGSESGYNYGSSQNQYFYPRETKKWRVLYNNNGQLDIISASSAGTLYLDDLIGYQKAIGTFENLCDQYVNSEFATSARNIGYDENSFAERRCYDIGKVSGIEWDGWKLYSNVKYWEGTPKIEYYRDGNGEEERDYIYSHLLATGAVWTSSRTYETIESGIENDPNDYHKFMVKYLNGANAYLVGVTRGGVITTEPAKAGEIRPIVSLKDTIYIVGGSGTQADPYKIAVPEE